VHTSPVVPTADLRVEMKRGDKWREGGKKQIAHRVERESPKKSLVKIKSRVLAESDGEKR
jgi:hypothetical protein